jgi:amino acid transporter
VLGFFTGFLNFFGWIFDLASITMILSNAAVQMHVAFDRDSYTTDGVVSVPPRQVYGTYLLVTWGCCAVVVFGNRFIPFLQNVGLFLVIVGGIVTIIVVAAMPKQHASNSTVWADWVNTTGWASGVAFFTGVLNGAYTIGTPDAITHMAEELPNPRRDLPRGVAAQIGLGTISTSSSVQVDIVASLS